MAEPTQYSFSLRELTTALIREQGLREGLWMVSFEFNFGAGLVGAPPEEAKPTAFAQIGRVQLVQPPEGTPKGVPMVVDAAQVIAQSKTDRPASQPRRKRTGAKEAPNE